VTGLSQNRRRSAQTVMVAMLNTVGYVVLL
jgi:hypothetical protein